MVSSQMTSCLPHLYFPQIILPTLLKGLIHVASEHHSFGFPPWLVLSLSLNL